MPSHPARGHFFLGRPYVGTTETLVAIDKEMRTGAETFSRTMARILSPEVRQRRARLRVRKHVNHHWRHGVTDGLDLLAWLRTLDWTVTTPKRSTT